MTVRRWTAVGALLLLAALAAGGEQALAYEDEEQVCGQPCRQANLKLLPAGWLLDHKGPKDITSKSQLNALGRFVAPILYGGLGNVLFQLAAMHTYAFLHEVPCVVGFFKHWNRVYNTFDHWGGHSAPFPGVTLKDTFPNMQWIAIEPEIEAKRVFNRNAFKTYLPDEYHPLPDKEMMPVYIHGYFFNHRFWHPARAEVLHKLAFHPSIEKYVTFMYGDWLNASLAKRASMQIGHSGGSSESYLPSVSLHLRYGYDAEPAMALLDDRKFPPNSFYDHVFSSVFEENVRYLVFSDNNAKATQFMTAMALKHDFEWALVDENVVMSVAIMARCQHHVLTSSTLSFWGAYLDKKQPHGGKTVLHSSFFKDHGENMVPPEYGWIVLN